MSTAEELKRHAARTLAMLNRIGGVIGDCYNVNHVNTRHANKPWHGRMLDWVLWRTPVRRWWTVKQHYWVEVDLADELEAYHEFGGIGLQDPDDISDLLSAVRGIKLWRRKYWEDPYTIFDVAMSFQPLYPAERITLELTLPVDPLQSTDTAPPDS